MSKYAVSTVFKSIDKVTAPVKKMQSAVGKFATSAENKMRKVDGAISAVGSGILGAAKKAGIGMALMGVSSVAAAGMMNQQQQEVENLTKAVNANITTVEAVSSAISSAGLNVDNVIDLYEEMNNKLGESAGLEEITAVSESLAVLGLRFTDIKKLAPEEQFKKITDAALKMKDASKAQAAMDMLMGGEANKVVGILRQQGKSMDDIINNYDRLSFRTERSRQGARDMARQQSILGKVVGSLGKEISGLVGVHMAPLIDKFNQFLIANKQIIGQSIDQFFEKITGSVGDVSDVFEKALSWLKQLHANFESVKEWSVTIAKVTAGVLALMAGLKIFIGVMTAVNLVMAANPATLIVMGIVAAIAALSAAAYAIYDNWESIKSFLLDSWESIKSAFGWTPIGAIMENWGGITDYFSNLFSGISDMYDKYVGSVMSGIKSVGEFLGLSDDETDVNVNRNVSSDVVVSPQERQAMYNGRFTGAVDVNVYGNNGVTPERPTYQTNLKLSRSGG